MSTITSSRPAADVYFKLVRAFPLRPIRGDSEYEQAGRILHRLLGRADGKLLTGERDYLDALVLLVQDYERRHDPFVPPKSSPADALKYLAAQAAMGPTELGKVLGSTHPMASMMLRGKRGISAQAARTLSKYFKVDSGLFI